MGFIGGRQSEKEKKREVNFEGLSQSCAGFKQKQIHGLICFLKKKKINK